MDAQTHGKKESHHYHYRKHIFKISEREGGKHYEPTKFLSLQLVKENFLAQTGMEKTNYRELKK